MKIIGNGSNTYMVYIEKENGLFILPNDKTTKYDLLDDENLDPIEFKFDSKKEVYDLLTNISEIIKYNIKPIFLMKKFAVERWY